MNNRKTKIIWAYVTEVILAILLVFLGCVTLGITAVTALVHQFAVDFATLYCAVFFAAALAFLWTFCSKADTVFYTWLDEIQAFHVYLHATGYVVAVEAVAIFLLVATKEYSGSEFSLIAAFAFFMAVINSYTMVKNVIDLMKLHTLFNRVCGANDKQSR
ncbi:hypothetical protein HZU83_17325 [Sphaerotilus montanus]|uniref:hypothetical protein n=1 Tax=Sphaerotilus montanus TaxID=522889 RepID=UPI0015D71794|nr:hypothetical protein [Sphaerotilus montanus]NZD58452.1 hypothetical protein [Sphaerotilus montanus]